jgi:hypothetical protein
MDMKSSKRLDRAFYAESRESTTVPRAIGGRGAGAVDLAASKETLAVAGALGSA